MRQDDMTQVLIVGAARQGTALARYLARHGATVVLNDRRKPSQLREARSSLAGLPIGWVLGAHPVRILEGADLVCPSGGVALELPLLEEARRRGIPLSNDSQIFLDQAPCPVIGITGSAGKTTTTTLVGRIAMAAAGVKGGPNVAWVGGNIGNPLIDVVDEMTAGDLAVIELSSFQLDLMNRAPHIAAILNITPNHLDRHGSMAAYIAAKANILKFQGPEDIAVLGRDDPGAFGLASMVKGKLATFGLAAPPEGLPSLLPEGGPLSVLDVHVRGEAVVLEAEGITTEVLRLEEIEMRGAHNLLNVLAACAIAAAAGLPVKAMRDGVRGFRGVPHRLEFVRRWQEADWYNDSIATAPERAIAGMRSFDEPLVLLAGGRDKDLPWDDFCTEVTRRVRHLVVFGETAPMIAEKVSRLEGERPETITVCSKMEQAVQRAAEIVSPGEVVLLSPGGTSFDEFPDFAERGVCFKRWVSELT
jgi:UDP-N-acetylmuramoylalanine--D-glutamate ligase